MNDRRLVTCRMAPGCKGIVGAWSRGEFTPSARLRPGRDLWIDAEGAARLRCVLCGAEHVLTREEARLTLRAPA